MGRKSSTLKWRGKFIALDPEKRSDIAKDWLKFAEDYIVDQPRLLEAVADALETSRMRVANQDKPVASIFVLGPSGVGKTLVPRVLADFLFDDPKGLVEIHCQDYSEQHAVARLTGPPPGYVGYDDGHVVFSQHTLDEPAWRAQAKEFFLGLSKENTEILQNIGIERKKILQQMQQVQYFKNSYIKQAHGVQDPRAALNEIENKLSKMGYPWYDPDNKTYLSVVLFDEIGLGHQTLQNLTEQILDNGRLFSTHETTTDFKNSFIFITDNAGSEEIADYLQKRSGKGVQTGFHGKQIKEYTLDDDDQEIYEISMRAAKKQFRTPYLNRMDHIIVARPLPEASLHKILNIQLRELYCSFVKQNCPILISISDEVKNFIVEESLDKPEENARLLIKKFKHYVIQPLTVLKNTQQIKEGDCIEITLKPKSKDEILFQKIDRNTEEPSKLILLPK